MAPRVEHLSFDFGVTDGRGQVLNFSVNYAPIVAGELRTDLADLFTLPSLVQKDPEAMISYQTLADRAERLRDQLESRLEREEVEIEGNSVAITRIISKLWVFPHEQPMRIQIDTRRPLGPTTQRSTVQLPDLTQAQVRLLNSIVTSIDAFCWKHLRGQHSISPPPPRPRVFISYRKGRESVAEAIAHRLGREGFDPWFDPWDINAGDSLPGKIEEGLDSSVAFVALVTGDYQEGRWATEELESAIHRRIEEGYPIIPVLLEDCEKPQLIRHLVHVDLRDRNPQMFESKMAELIDGINRLDRNPFH
jgi:hypothetical protein